MRLFLLMTLSVLLVPVASAQTPTVTGRVIDAADSTALPGATIVATAVADSTRRVGVVADPQGRFALRLPTTGTYKLRVSFVGYAPYAAVRTVPASGVDLGTVVLRADTLGLGDLVVEGVQERMRVRGDTTDYNAAAFRVDRNASAEDLVGKLPGVTIENGQVQAQGETVRRVLVDGEEFFGTDATLALRNLPAEVIERVQVFDRASEQAQFTGFDDGNSEKTINVVTRGGLRNSQFGKVYGGYGTDTRHHGGASVNVFNGTQRLSLIGLTNNIGQQNFAKEDLLGVLGGGGTGGKRGGDGGGRGMRGGGMEDAGTFLVDGQRGLTTTHALGLNYSNRWGERVRLSSSYFFNGTDNTSDVDTERRYVRDGAVGQRYTEASDAASDSYNHRFSARLQADLSPRDAITFTPRLSAQQVASASRLSGLTLQPGGSPINALTSTATSDGWGYASSANLTWRHRFAREGRTLSVSLNGGVDVQQGDARQVAESLSYPRGAATVDPALSLNQQVDTDVDARSLGARIAFTERVGKGGQAQLSYAPAWRQSTSVRNVFVFDPATARYVVLDTAQTSRYESVSAIQRGGVDYQWRSGRWRLSAGLDAQHERLTGDRAFPTPSDVEKTFTSLLPSAQLSYQVSRTNSLRVFYRTSTGTPSVGQLQDVVDTANPLFLSTGTPDLRPSYSHRLFARYNRVDPTSGRVLVGFASVSRTDAYVSTATVYAAADTLVRGIAVPGGAQLSYPVNLDGQWGARTFASVGLPVALVKSNLNINIGADVSSTPGLVDGTITRSAVRGLAGGLTLGSNISEQVDFTLSYEARFTTSRNTAYPALDADFTRHRGGLRLVWQPLGGLVVTSDVDASGYAGLDADLYPTTIQWNAGVGYRFLRQQAGEVRLAVADVLNQNRSLDRTITEVYVEDTRAQVLGRYVMLTFTYHLRNVRIGGATPTARPARSGRGD